MFLGAAAAANYAAARRAERRHPPRGHFVRVDGVRLHYLDEGVGRPIILLHGNGAIADDFVISGVFGRLATTHRVIAFDRPGFGYSDRPRDRIWSASAQAKLILHASDQLGLRNPIILAHSWGTLVALEMAMLEPHAVRGLVLVSGYYFPTPRIDVALLSPPTLPILGDLMRYTVSPILGWLLAPKLIRKLFAPAAVTEAFSQRFPIAMALRPWQIRASAADTALMIPGAGAMTDSYAELDLPVTILGAPGDGVVDFDDQAVALNRALPRSRLIRVDDAGHMLHHTQPGRVVAAVEDMSATVHASAHMTDDGLGGQRLDAVP